LNVCGALLHAVERPWRDDDIGTPKHGGASAWVGGVVAVTGSGYGFGQTADEAHFTYTRVEGDFDVIARLLAIDDTHPMASAGIVIRSSLDADASYAGLIDTNATGLSFERRLVDAWATLTTASPVNPPNVWMKLERRGPMVTAYVSQDGVTWVPLGSDAVDLGSNAYVGFVAASRRASALTTATFDQASISALGAESEQPPPTESNPPTTEGGGAVDPALPSEPASPVNAGDGGASAPPPPDVEQPVPAEPPPVIIATDPPPPAVIPDPLPPLLPPEPAASGAVPPAPDLSTPPPPTTLRYLVFEPSPDHDSIVSSYLLEIARVGGVVEVSQDIGKPDVLSGECRVDVAALLQQLPAGTYMALVSAVSPVGDSSGAASPIFTIQ
jgi:regulation of enolase protein 1 (concanavalin A-like superfamily)